jgi:hypothetical protein
MINDKSDREIRLRTGEPIMDSATTGRGAVDEEELLVHNWRVARLTRLGVPGSLAEAYAGRLDWHEVARLVQRGCPPRLALRIAS